MAFMSPRKGLRVTRSQEELCDDRVSYQPERMRQEEIVQMQQREMEYQRERDNGHSVTHQDTISTVPAQIL
ncbi:UNVERIFIED_CONTAM: hypothetical protein FKN15_006677 [Acipenser sinensis]